MKAAVALALLVAAPTAAHAYSEISRFGEPAVDGGGGGRYFTGAPTDGYSCHVCHDDVAAPPVTVTGMPDHIDPGATYDLTLSWPDDGRKYSLALELVDADGTPPATALPALADQPPEMRCAGNRTGASAAQLVTVGARRIVYVEPCGAFQVTVSFTPPSDEDLFIGAGVVAADGFETSDGDGSYELRRKLTSTVTSTTGCAVNGQSGSGVGLALAIGTLLLFRKRRH
ncbi:MAG: hypothetical protein JNK64_16825 [Myxococcales bacterium]|nr:hypothetical protein [Myxococcales bacterium]